MCVAKLEGHKREVTSLVVVGDGLLASGSRDSTVKVWDVASSCCVVTLEGHHEVLCLAMLKDARLVSGHNDGLRVWSSLLTLI